MTPVWLHVKKCVKITQGVLVVARISKEKILVVETEPLVSRLLKEVLNGAGYSCVTTCKSVEEGWKSFLGQSHSLVLIDYKIGSESGFDLSSRILSKNLNIPAIILVDAGHVADAVKATQNWRAFDVLEKPLDPKKVIDCVHRALESGGWRTEVIRQSKDQSMKDEYMGLVGASPIMKKIFVLIERIKESSVNVLITGPSGSGKELVAHAIHKTSKRSHKKFVAINCSAIPETLLEGELFGYKKGAFTDARTDKVGLFQEADGGTVLLDEIGDMPLGLQPKILRAIQEKEIRPLGAIHSVKVDVRIIAATNQDLKEKIKQKLFREDLFYRLNAMEIKIPPLKERPEDILLLVDYFLGRMKGMASHTIKGISQQAMKFLMHYTWPGNIRELENVLERATLLARQEYILPEDLLFSSKKKTTLPLSEWVKRRMSLSDIEYDYIMQVLDTTGGNRSETAHILGIGRKTLYNKLAKFKE